MFDVARNDPILTNWYHFVGYRVFGDTRQQHDDIGSVWPTVVDFQRRTNINCERIALLCCYIWFDIYLHICEV